MTRIRVGSCIPGEPVLAGVQNANTFAAPPSFAVRTVRNSARKSRQAAPDGITAPDRFRDSQQLRTNPRADAIRPDQEIMLGRNAAGESNANSGFLLRERL